MLLLMREEKPIGYPLLCAPQLVQGGQAKLPITAIPIANGVICAPRSLRSLMQSATQPPMAWRTCIGRADSLPSIMTGKTAFR